MVEIGVGVRTEPTEEPGLVPGFPLSTGGDRLRVLHVIVTLGPANAQFNEHCLPMRHVRDLTICSLHERSVEVPPEISVFEGDGTVRGFGRALRDALDAGPYDIVHAHAPGTAAMVTSGSLRARRGMTNLVLTVHNSRESFSLRNQALLATMFAAFPTVVFCSRAAAASFPRPMRALARTVEVVPNGVDTDRVARAISAAPIGAPDGFTVAAVGRLIPRKDPVTVLEAFRAACEPTARMLFVGDGVQRTAVLDGAARAGIADRVQVTGLVERDDVYRRLAGASVFVSAAHGEGLPVAVLEAMACGLPVVLSDIPPHREIAAGDATVPLVRPGDVGGFAAAIRALQASSPDERAALGARNRALVTQRFGLAAMHRSYERVYRAVLARSGRRVPERDGEVAA
jgi:glycosyltransferase involved in cell wall biosynthesis